MSYYGEFSQNGGSFGAQLLKSKQKQHPIHLCIPESLASTTSSENIY